jgi:inhibitor of KinA sporulation pathway (predicted exonuclease)
MTVLQTMHLSSAPATITVFDLEYTAWECSMASQWLRPGEFKEVVQIGAVRLDAASFDILDELDILVRPRINPELSPYFEQLTGITRAMAAQGVDFADAYDRFAKFADGGPICAFGHDEWVLEENIRLYGLKDAAPLPEFFDLRAWFAARALDPRGMLSCDVGPALGAPPQGRDHNALADARSLACGMAILRQRGASASLRPAA